MRERLRILGESLRGDTPAAAYALRALVGGEIIVTEIRQDGRQRFHLQGRFTIRANSVTDAVAGYSCDVDGSKSDTDRQVEVIVIDFVDPNPLDVPADEAKSLYDQGLMNAEIARILGRSRSQVTKLLKHWHESRGLTMPDGRSRRSQLKRKHLEPPLYQRISEDVRVLSDEGLLFQEIAERMHCNIATVSAALCNWYESRGMTAPDGRSRRKSLDRKVSKPRRSKVDDLPDDIEPA